MIIDTCKFVFGVPAFAMAVSLAGCGNSGNSATPSAQEQQAKQQQTETRVQNDPKMPPEVKANIMRQMQSEAAQRQGQTSANKQ